MTEQPTPGASSPSSDSSSHVDRRGVTMRDIIVGVVSGIVVTAVTLYGQNLIDDRRDTEAERRENLRFIREQSANGKADEVSFRGIDVGGRNLSGLDLIGADMAGANLVGADLTQTRFIGANLVQADLTNARIIETDFFNATLSGAVMSDTFIGASLFNNASLAGADMRRTGQPGTGQGSNFTGANLSYADFTGAQFPSAAFDGAVMLDTNFSGADLGVAKLPMRDGRIDREFIESISMTTKRSGRKKYSRMT